MQNRFNFDQRRSKHKHKRYRRPDIVRFVCSNHVTLRERLIRVAVEQKRHSFRKFLGRVSRSCRVCPMPYEAVEGSKPTCVVGQRLPVRSAQPRAMQKFLKIS